MTQADGVLPTPEEIRRELRDVLPLLERVEAALTLSARVPEGASIQTRFAALAALTDAYESLRDYLPAAAGRLGLPYDEVIENVTYVAVFGADD